MEYFRKDYQLPVCSECKHVLFFEKVYNQGKLYKIKPDGHPDNVDLSKVFHEQERLLKM